MCIDYIGWHSMPISDVLPNKYQQWFQSGSNWQHALFPSVHGNVLQHIRLSWKVHRTWLQLPPGCAPKILCNMTHHPNVTTHHVFTLSAIEPYFQTWAENLLPSSKCFSQVLFTSFLQAHRCTDISNLGLWTEFIQYKSDFYCYSPAVSL